MTVAEAEAEGEAEAKDGGGVVYQQKCPIYQNSKAERDMVLLLMM